MVEKPDMGLSGAGAPADRRTGLVDAVATGRLVLRCAADVTAVLAPALGCPLPARINTATTAGERAALMLGPDEWLLLVPVADVVAVEAAMAAAFSRRPHSLVDVSHRQLALLLEGPQAERVLNVGVPLDVDVAAFPVGTATRTLFDKAEIVLWRTGQSTFRIETGRSVLPYLRAMLDEAMAEMAAV
jgi:sarcosine oxidase subunit gamma